MSYPESSKSPTKEERRKKVVLGDLPNDFLRVGTSATNNEQIQSDENAARALQHQFAQQAGVVAPAQFGKQMPYGAFIPANTRGRLSVTLLEARLEKNYGLPGIRMDPYCRLRVGNTFFETPTDVSGGKTPKWNRTVQCYLPQGIESVFVEIYDERAFTQDERVAFAHIKIPERCLNENESADDWYALSGGLGDGKEGMINVMFQFGPVTAPVMQYQPITQLVAPAGAPMPAQQVQQHNQPQPPSMTDVDPAAPRFSEQDVKELSEMFPNITSEVIESVLIEKSGNKDAAVNALLSIASD